MTITKKRAFSIALLITGANIIGKFLGFGKDILISYHYGATEITDAIFLAMSIPMLILGIFTNSTDSAIIPQYNRIASNEGKKSADKHFSNIVNSVSIVTILISLLMLISPNVFIDIFAPGFNEVQRVYSNQFLRIFSFFGFMHVLYCFFSSYNTIYARILPRAILSFTTNLLVVIALLIYPDPHLKSLSLAFLVGNILAGLIPLTSAIRNEYKHRFVFFDINNEMEKFVKLFLPIMGVALLTNIHLFVDKFLASSMSEGSVSYLNYASRLTAIFDSMLVVGLGVVILPSLSKSRISKNYDKFNRDSTQVIKLLLILLLPIATLCMLLSVPIIKLIYMRGEFGIESVLIVSNVFFWYSIQILNLPLNATLVKVFHSIEDTKTPFIINIITVVVNIILSIILSYSMGIQGIAIATSISMTLSIILLLLKIINKIGWDRTVLNLKEFIKILICLIVLVVTTLFMKIFTGDTLIGVAITSLFAGGGYLISFAILLKSDFKYLLSFIKK